MGEQTNGESTPAMVVTPQPMTMQIGCDIVATKSGTDLLRICVFSHQGQTVIFQTEEEASELLGILTERWIELCEVNRAKTGAAL